MRIDDNITCTKDVAGGGNCAVLKFKCESCGKVFDELVKLSDVEALRCPDCGGRVRRAYEGKCLGAKSEGCSGNCSCCSGCHH